MLAIVSSRSRIFSPTQGGACSVDLLLKSKLQADGFGEGAEASTRGA
jgi:hypothetical protein